MTNACIEFDNIYGVTPDYMSTGKIKPGYEHVNFHMVFGINMDGKFTRKELLVSDEHKTSPPSSIIYSSVVSRRLLGLHFYLHP